MRYLTGNGTTMVGVIGATGVRISRANQEGLATTGASSSAPMTATGTMGAPVARATCMKPWPKLRRR
jgi:hypothetical protein